MLNNSVLNVVISLIFIFLLYSLLATALHEALSNIFQGRANTLYKGIKQMLTNTNLKQNTFARIGNYLWCKLIDSWGWLKSWFSDKEEVDALYNRFYHHPIIKNYGENAVFSKPSYLDAGNFSNILVDTIKNLDPSKELLKADFAMIKDIIYRYSENGLEKIPDSPPDKSTKVQATDRVIDCETFKILNYHLNEAAGDLNVFKQRLEKWFNDSMDRVSGWYKRHTQFLLLLIGLFMAITLNIDTIGITNYLSRHKQESEILANMGAIAVKDSSFKSTTDSISKKNLNNLIVESDSVSNILGLGWGNYGQKDKAFVDSLKNNNPGWIAKLFSFINGKSALYDSLNKPIHLKEDTISNRLFNKYGFYIKRQYVYSKIDLTKFIGFLITAIAISLGAPFWFDLLSKIVNLRSSGKPINPSGSTSKKNNSDGSIIEG
jgi:hypothetical protein